MANIPIKDQIWSIPEIVEAIFVELPIRDLLVNIQLVNRAWNNTIKSSPFQKRLFFEPRPKIQAVKPEINSLLSHRFPAFFTRCGDENLSGRWPHEKLSEADRNRSLKKIEAYSRKEASWRRMLVAQPPVTTIQVIKTTSTQGRKYRTEGHLKTCYGLKMGTIYDLVEAEIHSGSTHHSNRFDLEWPLLPPPAVKEEEEDMDFIPLYAQDPKDGLMVHFSSVFSCCAEMRDDYEVPEYLKGRALKDMTRDEQKQIMKAQMSNARPHLKSKAYSPVNIEWGQSQTLRDHPLD